MQSGRLRDGVPDIKDTAEFAQLVAPYPNVYAELGTIFASSVVTFPTVCAHLMGILFKYLGADRIVWGTDSTFYGSPQWQIEAFWRLQIPEAFRERYGYPEITPEMKRKVLGLNSARLYGMSARRDQIREGPRRLSPTDRRGRRPHEDDGVRRSAAERSPMPAKADDRLASLRARYRERAETRFGVPLSNWRDGWIRTR